MSLVEIHYRYHGTHRYSGNSRFYAHSILLALVDLDHGVTKAGEIVAVFFRLMKAYKGGGRRLVKVKDIQVGNFFLNP